MAEYICREAVLSKCADIWDNADETTQTGVDTINAIDRITDFIEAMPAAEVQPVKRGKWEEVTDYGGWGDTHYRCSVCGEEWYLEDGKPKDNNMNFCPRCGARMDGEQNDNSET